MKRARSAAFWIAPPLACLLLYWYGLKSWFAADDFAWLGLHLEVHGWRSFLDALFAPRAQGTIRPWSERAFFMGFYQLFGLDAVPFRIWVFLTQFANLALVASIARRLTGSAAAALCAALLWVANTALVQVMTWTSAYNQALCAFFILLAFHFLLRFIETGRRRYQVLQWVAFLLGFGAQELNVVYPALAAGFTLLLARKRFLSTLPLFVPSLLFTWIHMRVAPMASQGVYVMHWDLSIFQTLFTYWTWTVGPTWLLTPWNTPPAVVWGCVGALSAALLGFTIWCAVRGDRVPLFFLSWFLVTLAPVLPLRDHVTDYYLFLPAAGLAMLGGYAVARAWRSGPAIRAAAVVLAAAYLALAVPQAHATARWQHDRSRRVERLVRGVERAAEIHPGCVILLDGVDDELFWIGVLDQPFRLFRASVFLTPGSEARIQPHPEYGDPAAYVLPAEASMKALNNGTAVVYAANAPRLRNITSYYADALEAKAGAPPRRVDVGNPLMTYLLGPEWHQPDRTFRWMPRRATLRIGGPTAPGQQLHVTGYLPEQQVERGPLEFSAAAGGILLGARRLAAEGRFDIAFPLPAPLVGQRSLEIAVQAGRTFRVPGDVRELSLIFGVFEIK